MTDPSELMDDRLAELGDWRAETLASLSDPEGLFNSGLGGKVRRAIDIKEGEKIDPEALKNLVRQAVALNLAK